jgi:hypothetical protein
MGQKDAPAASAMVRTLLKMRNAMRLRSVLDFQLAVRCLYWNVSAQKPSSTTLGAGVSGEPSADKY